MKKRHLPILMAAIFLFSDVLSIKGQNLLQPGMVNRFYKNRKQALLWFSPEGDTLRHELLSVVDSAAYQGLDSLRYHLKEIRDWETGQDDKKMFSNRQMDELYTDAMLGLLTDLQNGFGIYSHVSYNGLSSAIEPEEAERLLSIVQSASPGIFKSLAAACVPHAPAYDTLRSALIKALTDQNKRKVAQLSMTLNVYRWIRHYRFPRFIVVNIPSATLYYYDRDSLRLAMKIVAGQPSKRTPRFAAWCDQLILYPYWNVPRRIAANELLPIFKRSPSMVAAMKMQVLDSKGRIVDPSAINWSKYNRDNLIYTFRQSTGCDNALGVIKFNLISPYDVYMHDTNLKIAFMSIYRYYSHGCIRLEKPMDLALALLNNKLDTTRLLSCLKDQIPYAIQLEDPVPVFVVYITAGIAADGRLRFHRDIYHLLQ
jgi:murein L,D-transpeptidase YcbB/YkuD